MGIATRIQPHFQGLFNCLYLQKHSLTPILPTHPAQSPAPLYLSLPCHQLYVYGVIHVETRGRCFSISFYLINYYIMYVGVMSMQLLATSRRGSLIPLELELQVVVICPIWVLGTECLSYERAASTVNH